MYLNAGVPQGSLLFVVFINDIVEEINPFTRLFADDTSLYIVADDPLDSAIELNADLSRIDMWASKWLSTFNPSKFESLIFSRIVNKPYYPPIYMHYQQVNEVNSHNHLGIYLCRDLHGMNISSTLKPRPGKEYKPWVV